MKWTDCPSQPGRNSPCVVCLLLCHDRLLPPQRNLFLSLPTSSTRHLFIFITFTPSHLKRKDFISRKFIEVRGSERCVIGPHLTPSSSSFEKPRPIKGLSTVCDGGTAGGEPIYSRRSLILTADEQGEVKHHDLGSEQEAIHSLHQQQIHLRSHCMWFISFFPAVFCGWFSLIHWKLGC